MQHEEILAEILDLRLTLADAVFYQELGLTAKPDIRKFPHNGLTNIPFSSINVRIHALMKNIQDTYSPLAESEIGVLVIDLYAKGFRAEHLLNVDTQTRHSYYAVYCMLKSLGEELRKYDRAQPLPPGAGISQLCD